MLIFPTIFAFLFASSGFGAVESFSACIGERPWLPYTHPDLEKPGSMQILVYNASRDLRVRIEVEPLPWKRCLDQVRHGRIDAVIGASPLPFIQRFAEFPKSHDNHQIDGERSLGSARVMLVKRKDSPIEWDGTTLAHLKKPVGTALGASIVRQSVEEFGGTVDEAARTDDQNLRKLIQDRVDLMAGYEYDLKYLIQKSYKGQVTLLLVPLVDSQYYLAFSKSFYRQHVAFVEALWYRIGRLQNRPFRQILSNENLTSATHQHLR